MQCFLTAGGDSDRSLEDVDAGNNTTIVNMVPHTFTASGSVVLACDDPDTAQLLVTNKKILAIPLAALINTALP